MGDKTNWSKIIMIKGIGTDIVKISRIAEMYHKFSDKFIVKILSSEEIKKFNGFSVKKKKISYLAKRFSAKEAFVKALGTGFRDNITFAKISVLNNKLGKPQITLADDIAFLIKDRKVLVSLSDEEDLAIAFVTIEKIYKENSEFF